MGSPNQAQPCNAYWILYAYYMCNRALQSHAWARAISHSDAILSRDFSNQPQQCYCKHSPQYYCGAPVHE